MPPESWARCGSWSAGLCWHPRPERWTTPAFGSPLASVWDWGNGTLQRKRHFFFLNKKGCGTLNLQHYFYTTFNTALTVNNLSIIYVWTKYNSASLKDFQSTSYSDSQLEHVYHNALFYFCA